MSVIVIGRMTDAQSFQQFFSSHTVIPQLKRWAFSASRTSRSSPPSRVPTSSEPHPREHRRVSGETDLSTLISTLAPKLRSGEFVFVTTDAPGPADAEAMVHEAEGVTYVVPRDTADERALRYDFIAAWITLEVHSSLEAVGLTAAVATTLAEAGISCNVLAGYFHDHLLVPVDRAEDALRLLRDLRDGDRTWRGSEAG
jgi:hypothetical protein